MGYFSLQQNRNSNRMHLMPYELLNRIKFRAPLPSLADFGLSTKKVNTG